MRRSPVRSSALMLVIVALAVTGCSKSTTTTMPSVSMPAVAANMPNNVNSMVPPAGMAGGELSGKWTGQYSGSYQGTFVLVWHQSGSKLTGTIKLSSVGGAMAINGSVSGDTIEFGTVGSTAITYSGKVSGSSMSGSYHVAGGGGSGSWSATQG